MVARGVLGIFEYFETGVANLAAAALKHLPVHNINTGPATLSNQSPFRRDSGERMCSLIHL